LVGQSDSTGGSEIDCKITLWDGAARRSFLVDLEQLGV